MVNESVLEWLAREGFGELRSTQPVSGGCINNGARLQTKSGKSFFLKTNRQAPPDMFAREAEGLTALGSVGEGSKQSPRVPKVFLYGQHFLLLEDLNPAQRKPDYWPVFGRQLAVLHNCTNPQFGFDHDNYIGSTPQPNTWQEQGALFFAEYRLGFQARLAQRQGLLGPADVRRVQSLAERLPDLVPVQPASLIHGDLWGGNAISDENGGPAIIDPAAHYGWAEAELAMTTLFGSFPEAFYQAYQEVRPLEPGYRARFPVYNLYHLLNHLNLFGSGYLAQIRMILRRFAD
jgi:protein-ribulosamine 3-kinase